MLLSVERPFAGALAFHLPGAMLQHCDGLVHGGSGDVSFKKGFQHGDVTTIHVFRGGHERHCRRIQ